ncbi:MAG: ATP-binding protein [Spirochaetales bacterium]|nr:MAG: ATP-binding protein [Spirochaetales bacterium]
MHASLADMLTDVVQNSVEAGADHIHVLFEESAREIHFSVKDNGKGMSRQTLEKALDPFWSDGEKHPGRRVGLGLPFLRQTAQQCGGRVDIESEPEKGTSVEAFFPADNVDLPPLGDLVLLWMQCLAFEGNYGMNIRRIRRDLSGNGDEYEIDRNEISAVLGGLEDMNSLGLLREYLQSQENALNE